MAINRTRLNGSPSKQLVSASARKLLGITTIITKADNPDLPLDSLNSLVRKEDLKTDHVREHYRDGVVSVWDASSVGSAVGEPILTAKLAWEPGKAQGYIPVSYGLVIQTPIECVVIWDT